MKSKLSDIFHRSVLRVQRHLPVIFLAGGAAIFTVIVHVLFFPHLSDNPDEAVYLQQAHALLDGYFRFPQQEVPIGADERPLGFLHIWLTGYHDQAYFTKYQPGYPTLVAFSLLIFGTPIVALGLAAAGLVLGVYALGAVLFSSNRIGFAGALAVAFSPILFIQSAIYLSYATSSALMCAGVAAVVYGARCRADCHPHCVKGCHGRCQRRRWLIIGGFIFGVLLMIRQFDAVLVVSIVTAYVLVRWGRNLKHFFRIVGGVGVGGLPALILVMAFASHVTGSPFLMPFKATDPMDSFGFGLHRMLPYETIYNYTPALAFEAMVSHLIVFPQWIVGGMLGIITAMIGLFVGKGNKGSRLLIFLLLLAFPIGYFLFWGMMMATFQRLDTQGPLYYIPMLILLTVLMGRGLVISYTWLFQRLRSINMAALWSGRLLVLVFTVFSLSISFVNLNGALGYQEEINHRSRALLAGIPPYDSLKRPAVILLSMPASERYVGKPFQVLSNPYLGDQSVEETLTAHPVVLAASQEAEDVRIAQALPGRALYGYRLPVMPEENSWVPASAFVPMTLISGPGIQLNLEVTIPAGPQCHVAFLTINSQRRELPLSCNSQVDHTMSSSWTLSAEEVSQALNEPLSEQGLTTKIIVGVARSDQPVPASGFQSPFDDQWWQQAHVVEHRHSTMITGSVQRNEADELTVLTPGVPWEVMGEPAAGVHGDDNWRQWQINTTETGVRVNLEPMPAVDISGPAVPSNSEPFELPPLSSPTSGASQIAR